MATSSFLGQYLFGKAAASGRAGLLAEAKALPGRRAPVYLANRFQQIVRGLVAEVLEPAGLTVQQWGVMIAIHREPGIDQRRVAERQSIDANSASRLVDELEQMGLVRRVNAPNDRRAYQLEFTAAGKAKRARLQGPVLAAQDRALACLAPAESEMLLDLLTRVVEANPDYARPGAGRRKPARKAEARPPVPSRARKPQDAPVA